MVRIITDSTSDITQEDAVRMNVTVVPLTVLFGSSSFRDGIDLSKKDFFDKLAVAETLPMTSQIPPGEFTPLFQRYIDAGRSAAPSGRTLDRALPELPISPKNEGEEYTYEAWYRGAAECRQVHSF